jgi:hypothetical protein
MSKLILDKNLIGQLKDLKEKMEFYDQEGKILGHFTPIRENSRPPVPFTDTELLLALMSDRSRS